MNNFDSGHGRQTVEGYVRNRLETTVVGRVSRPVSIRDGSGDPSYKCHGLATVATVHEQEDTMKKTLCILTCCLVGSLIAAQSNARAAQSEATKPNIVLFFIDDLGYGDIQPYGSTKNKTPNLNALAEQGLRFTNFYVASTQCSPSRSALMTGCYAERVNMHGGVCFPHLTKALNPKEYTLAEMIKDAGYATGCFGKWHLGHLPGYLPPSQGFDEYTGIPYSNDMWVKGRRNYPPLPLIEGEKPVALVNEGKDQALLCKVFTEAAVDFIEANRSKPFFCYIPHAFVHHPRFARKDFVTKAGGDVTRATIEEIDWSVGQIMKTLKELGLDKNTLVFFMSDNGGSGGCDSGPLRGGKGGGKYEGHQRTPLIAWWPGRIPADKVSDEIGVTCDLYPTLVKIAGGTLPKTKIDGKDISEMFFAPDRAKSPHQRVRYGSDGLRDGKWKLVRKGPELYDLETDPGEKKNLAGRYPQKVEQMKQLLSKWSADIMAEARPNAQMKPLRPLVAKGDDTLPSVSEWIKK